MHTLLMHDYVTSHKTVALELVNVLRKSYKCPVIFQMLYIHALNVHYFLNMHVVCLSIKLLVHIYSQQFNIGQL